MKLIMMEKAATNVPAKVGIGPLQGAQEYVLSHRKEIIFLGLIFLVAFGIRGHQMVYELFFEFDGYFHARMTEFVLTHGFIPKVDPLAYYQIPGGLPLPQFQDGPFWWLLTGTLFKILTLNAPYDRAVFFVAVKFFPAIFGALTAVAMYLLGKEMYGKRAGVAMAFFAAVIPAFVYRTMAGWFEGQSIGFLWMVLGMAFLVRAIKGGELNRGTIINALLAAFFFALMSWTWQAFLMVPYILLGLIGLTALMLVLRYVFTNDNPRPHLNSIANCIAVFAVFAALATAIIGTPWLSTFTANFGAVFGQGGVLSLGNAGQTSGSVFSISVGEESKGNPYWGNKYNALAVFIGWPLASGTFPWYIPGLVFIFLLYRLFTRKDDRISALAFTWIAFAIFLAYIKLKFTFYLGIPLALAAGITINDALSFVGERSGFEKKLVAILAGFIFLVGLAAGSFFIYQNQPNIEYDTGWKESLYWISQNTPQDSKFFNWWDEGHWLTFIGQRAASTDNRNGELKSNADFANFALAPDGNAAYQILDSRYHPDYVIVSEDLVGKLGSLGIYAYGTTDHSDPRVSQYFSVVLPCSRNEDPLTKAVVFSCGGNQLGEAQFNALPAKRIDQPNQTLDGKQKVFIYRNEDRTALFIMNKPANDTFLVRLFFDKENLGRLEQVYSFKEVRIFKYQK